MLPSGRLRAYFVLLPPGFVALPSISFLGSGPHTPAQDRSLCPFSLAGTRLGREKGRGRPELSETPTRLEGTWLGRRGAAPPCLVRPASGPGEGGLGAQEEPGEKALRVLLLSRGLCGTATRWLGMLACPQSIFSAASSSLHSSPQSPGAGDSRDLPRWGRRRCPRVWWPDHARPYLCSGAMPRPVHTPPPCSWRTSRRG